MITGASRVHSRLERTCAHLGSGVFSSVYAHPRDPTKAIKVNRCPDGGMAYLHWANENGYGGREAPKVFVAHEYPDGTYIAIVERLKCTLRAVEGTTTYDEGREWKKGFYDKKTPFAKAMHSQFGEAGDLHNDNIMVRGESEFVMTDPAVDGENSSSYTRHRYP